MNSCVFVSLPELFLRCFRVLLGDKNRLENSITRKSTYKPQQCKGEQPHTFEKLLFSCS